MKASHVAGKVWQQLSKEKTADREGSVLQGNLIRTRVKLFAF